MNSRFTEEDVQMENQPTTRYSTSLAIREIQIKTIMSYRFTSVRIAKIKIMTTPNIGEGAEKLFTHTLLAGM